MESQPARSRRARARASLRRCVKAEGCSACEDWLIAEYCIDIGIRKRAQQELELLSRELSHRVKNTLGIVHLNVQGVPTTSIAEALRARGIPFVIVSGYAAQFADTAALRDAPQLSKPVNDRELLDALGTAAAA